MTRMTTMMTAMIVMTLMTLMTLMTMMMMTTMMTAMIMMTMMTTMMTEMMMMMMIRYELPPPPPGKMTDLQAWTECVENSEAQLEHQRTRIMNLDLMLDYGGESWKQYNDVLQEMLSRIQTQLTEVKQTIQEINWSRKDQQTKVGERLKQLESNWVGLVSKNYEIEQAVITMEHEYNILKYEHDQQKEKEQTVQ